MKKKYFINANIIDPHNSLNENGGLIISEEEQQKKEYRFSLLLDKTL